MKIKITSVILMTLLLLCLALVFFVLEKKHTPEPPPNLPSLTEVTEPKSDTTHLESDEKTLLTDNEEVDIKLPEETEVVLKDEVKESIFIKDEEALMGEGDVAQLFAKAARYEETGYYNFAEEIYQQIVKDYSGTDHVLEAQKKLIAMHISMDNSVKAEATFKTLAATSPGGNLKAYYEMEVKARTYERDGYNDLAEPIYKKIMLQPDDDLHSFKAHKKLVMLYVTLDRDTEAEELLSEFVARFSSHTNVADAVNKIAAKYFDCKKYEKAKELYEYALYKWPQADSAIFSQKGIVISNIFLDKIEQAQEAKDELIIKFREHKSLPRAVREIAEQYRILDKFQQAGETFQFILDTWPETVLAIWSQMGLVKIHISEGDESGAEAAFNTMIEKFSDRPRIAEGIFQIAIHYGNLGDYQKARQMYQYIVDNCPKSWMAMWAQSEVARCSITLGDYDTAEEAVKKLIKNHSDSDRMGETFYDIAQSYYRTGNFEKAQQYYEIVVKKWPGFRKGAWAQVGLAQTYIALDKNKLADLILTKLIGRYSDSSYLPAPATEAYFYAAECYRKMGEHQKAIKCYQRIANDCPGHTNAADALFMVGHSYEKLGKLGDISKEQAEMNAQAAYIRLVDQYPDSESAPIARNWLNR